MSLDSVRWDAGSGENRTRAKPTPTPIGQGARVGEPRVNFPSNFAAWRPRDSVYDVFVARKMQVHTDAEFE
jgi:hypothetical protein